MQNKDSGVRKPPDGDVELPLLMTVRSSLTNTVVPTLVGLRATWRIYLKCRFPGPAHTVDWAGLGQIQGIWTF